MTTRSTPIASRSSPISRASLVGRTSSRVVNPVLTSSSRRVAPLGSTPLDISAINRGSSEPLLGSVNLFYPYDEEDLFTLITYDTTPQGEKHYVYSLVMNVPGADIEQGYALMPYEVPKQESGRFYAVEAYRQESHFSSFPPPVTNRWFDVSLFVKSNNLYLVAKATLDAADPRGLVAV